MFPINIQATWPKMVLFLQEPETVETLENRPLIVTTAWTDRISKESKPTVTMRTSARAKNKTEECREKRRSWKLIQKNFWADSDITGDLSLP